MAKKKSKPPSKEAVMTEAVALYRKHRPGSLDEIVGQESAVQVLESKFKSDNIPHCILFTGPSGCGKTTLARIVKDRLDCKDVDFTELNCADFRGIEMVRDIRTRMYLAPMGGKCRVWLIDEAHQLTKDAQTALLKMMEDTPAHVYFMLATTDAGKLLPTIKNRCIEVKVKNLTPKELQGVLVQVSEQEWGEPDKFTDDVLEKIAEMSEGSARAAIQLLDSISGIEGEEEQLEALEKSSYKSESIEICRALLNPRTQWGEMAKILKGCELEDVEKLRRMVLGYMANVILGGGKNAQRAYLIIQAFRDNLFDSGKAGFACCCYEVIVGG